MRVEDVKKFGLCQFKQNFESFVTTPDGNKNADRFVLAIESAKKTKEDKAKKDEIEAEKKKAVAEALAKAAADGEGGLMRRFFS